MGNHPQVQLIRPLGYDAESPVGFPGAILGPLERKTTSKNPYVLTLPCYARVKEHTSEIQATSEGFVVEKHVQVTYRAYKYVKVRKKCVQVPVCNFLHREALRVKDIFV